MNSMTESWRQVVLAAVVLGTAIGCSSGTCRIPIAQTGCAATFEDQVNPGPCSASAGVCGAYRVWLSPPNLSSMTCVYDESGQYLLSGMVCTDTAIYCGNSQSCASGGQSIDLSKSCDVTRLAKACPNDGGGSDADATGDAVSDRTADMGADSVTDAGADAPADTNRFDR